MPIHWREDLQKRWAVMVYTDPYTRAEWEGAVTAILAHPISHPVLKLLGDRRHCRAPAADFVRHIADFARRHHDRFRNASIAIVAADQVGFGVARMTELLFEAEIPCAVEVFREWTEAEAWLASQQAV